MNIKDLENKIINDDCLNILKQLPDKCIDLILTDPPYGINASSKNFINGTSTNKQLYGKNWDNSPPKNETFKEIFRTSKNQIIFGANYFPKSLFASSGWIFWDKCTGNNSYSDGELAFCSMNKAFKKYTLAWIGANAKDTPERLHPTQKPLKLFEMILRDYSKENDLILDCFSGSGTTAIASHNLNRRFICIEKDYDYWKASVERLENAKSQLNLFTSVEQPKEETHEQAKLF